jgi:hypothetical protein
MNKQLKGQDARLGGRGLRVFIVLLVSVILALAALALVYAYFYSAPPGV